MKSGNTNEFVKIKSVLQRHENLHDVLFSAPEFKRDGRLFFLVICPKALRKSLSKHKHPLDGIGLAGAMLDVRMTTILSQSDAENLVLLFLKDSQSDPKCCS